MALATDEGRMAVRLAEGGLSAPPAALPWVEQEEAVADEAADELERLRTIISVLAFEPLAQGVRSRGEALHVLGFPPSADPDPRTLKAKFRMLATIHHPDSLYGSHQRMSQLNQAMELLRDENAPAAGQGRRG